MAIDIDQQIFLALSRHALRDAPQECCGILIGKRHGEDADVTGAIEADNIAENQREKSYQIDWRTLLDAARNRDFSHPHLIGFYHSHTHGDDHPSRQDTEFAWIDHSYVILSVVDSTLTAISGWRIPHRSSLFSREPLTVCGSLPAIEMVPSGGAIHAVSPGSSCERH